MIQSIIAGIHTTSFVFYKLTMNPFVKEIILRAIDSVFTIVVIGGIGYFIKYELDKENKKKKAEKKEKEVKGEFRTQVVDEFINIYSGFYEVRRVYNTIISNDSQALDPKIVNNLKEQCLKDSVKYDAKFGSLKVRLSNHYELPKGNWEKSGIESLRSQIDEATNYRSKLRLKLDLLGEYYHTWLDALTSGIKIDLGNTSEFHDLYDSILSDLNYSKITAPSEK